VLGGSALPTPFEPANPRTREVTTQFDQRANGRRTHELATQVAGSPTGSSPDAD